MKAVIALELIGDNYVQYERLCQQGRVTNELPLREYIRCLRSNQPRLRPGVWRITLGDDQLNKSPIKHHNLDFSRTNSDGSRGIYAYYVLDPGVYEVNERLTWEKSRRYFICVDGDTITEISREEVLAWLGNATSASVS